MVVHLGHAVVSVRTSLAVGDDQIARAHVAVHQSIAMQNVQRIARRSQPAQNQWPPPTLLGSSSARSGSTPESSLRGSPSIPCHQWQ